MSERAPGKFSYAEAETLLAHIYGAGPLQRNQFRGRLKHLKRLGIPLGINPGRGSKIEYDEEYLYQWAFCLSLEQFNIDPTSIYHLVATHWDEFIFNSFKKAAYNMNIYSSGRNALPIHHVWFWFIPDFLRSTWIDKSRLKSHEIPGFVKIGWTTGGDSNLMRVVGEQPRRYSLFSITEIVQAVHNRAGSIGSEDIGFAGQSIPALDWHPEV